VTMDIVVRATVLARLFLRKLDQKVGALGIASMVTGIIVIIAILAGNLILLLLGLVMYLVCVSLATFKAYKNYREGEGRR